MARQRKKKGRDISGWIILDKPAGMGSTQAVGKVKWLFNAQKAGHAGTLDPLASGMLPIALGDATKTVPYVMDGAKIYTFTVAWGQERATDDLEGAVTKTSDKRPTRAEVEAVMPAYTGTIQQTPPQYSAIKIDGERAYDLAREGETVEIASREVEIHLLVITAMDENTTTFEVECGKGTYVRSMARDMGRDLGCYGHVSMLRREEVFPFTAEDFVTVEELEAARGEPAADAGDEEAEAVPAKDRFAAIDMLLIETEAALEDLPHVALNDEAATRVRLGNPVIVRGRDAPVEADEAYVTARGKLLAIGFIEAGQFNPRRVFGG